MSKYFEYIPQPYTTNEDWQKHIFAFLFVMFLCYLAFTRLDPTLHMMAWITVFVNIAVLLLAIYESRRKEYHDRNNSIPQKDI